MNDDRLRMGVVIVLILVMLFYLTMGIEFLLFQPWLESAFGIRVLEPELLRYYGTVLIGTGVLLLLGLRSHSFKVMRPIIQALVISNLFVVGLAYYHYTFTHAQAYSTYMTTGVVSLIITLMLVLALRMNARD